MASPPDPADGGPPRRASRLPLPALAAAILLLRIAWMAGPALLVDDAFISFRYAANLAHGLGLVYNPGERVEGYSNFLWTLLLAAGLRLRIPPAATALALSVLAALATLVLLRHLARHLLGGAPHAAALAGLCAVLYAAHASVARLATSGLETVGFLFLLVAAWDLALARRRPLAASACFAAAALTRPEGLFYWALTAGVLLVIRPSGPTASADPQSAAPPRSRRLLPRPLRPGLSHRRLLSPRRQPLTAPSERLIHSVEEAP